MDIEGQFVVGQAVQHDIAIGEIVTITAAVVDTKLEDGRRMCLVQFDRNGESVSAWLREDELTGLGFDD